MTTISSFKSMSVVAIVVAIACYRFHKNAKERREFADFLLISKENDGKLINQLPSMLIPIAAAVEAKQAGSESPIYRYICDSTDITVFQQIIALQLKIWKSIYDKSLWCSVDWDKRDENNLPKVRGACKLIPSTLYRKNIPILEKIRILFTLGWVGYSRWSVVDTFARKMNQKAARDSDLKHWCMLRDVAFDNEDRDWFQEALRECITTQNIPTLTFCTKACDIPLFTELGFKRHSKFRYNDINTEETLHEFMWVLVWLPKKV